jgi:hypothetical protein
MLFDDTIRYPTAYTFPATKDTELLNDFVTVDHDDVRKLVSLVVDACNVKSPLPFTEYNPSWAVVATPPASLRNTDKLLTVRFCVGYR